MPGSRMGFVDDGAIDFAIREEFVQRGERDEARLGLVVFASLGESQPRSAGTLAGGTAVCCELRWKTPLRDLS